MTLSQLERDIAMQATLDAAQRTRRALVVVSSIIALGYFYLFHWYGSWQLARVSAWEGIARARHTAFVSSEARQSGKGAPRAIMLEPGTVSAPAPNTRDAREWRVDSTLEHESAVAQARADALRKDWSDRQFVVPALGLSVAASDFPVAIMIVALSVLLWLLFYQRRLNACLDALAGASGWETTKRFLELHFVLLGKHATRSTQRTAQALMFALPLLALLFLASDAYDLRRFYVDRLFRLAFDSADFRWRVAFRLTFDTCLFIATAIVGRQCLLEYGRSQDELLRLNRSA